MMHDEQFLKCPHCGDRHEHHCPSPKEIAELCDKLQRRWTPVDEKRKNMLPAKRWEVPTISDFGYDRSVVGLDTITDSAYDA